MSFKIPLPGDNQGSKTQSITNVKAANVNCEAVPLNNEEDAVKNKKPTKTPKPKKRKWTLNGKTSCKHFSKMQNTIMYRERSLSL